MRVLHITPSFGVGGAEQMAGHLMAGLSASHDVSGASLYRALDTSIEKRLRQANIPLWHLNKHPGFDPRMFRAVNQVLKTVRPDVVHTHLSVLRYALPALLCRRVPAVVHTIHNLAEHENDRFGRALQWFAFRRAVLPVAISQQVAASVERVYGIECNAVVPNCIPIEKYRRNPDAGRLWRKIHGFSPEATLFICVGRLEPQKNPMLLLEAFAALHGKDCHLVMLGSGTLRMQVAKFMRDRGLQARVHLLGSRGDIPDCLAAADVFVLASNWEGNPLSVMEAMAASLPVVSTAVGGVPELVESGRHGILVKAGDGPALAAAMHTLLIDLDLRRSMSCAARARAEARFDVSHMARGYSRLYEQALTAAAATCPILR